MKKMNNKAFAISTMLYGLLILIVLVIAMILSTMAFNRKNSREFSEQIVDQLEKTGDYTYSNSNIIRAYRYHENDCPTGEESICEPISINSTDSIEPGTIIKYKVNDTNIVTFHVMHDNGSTLTMQSQKNTVNNTMWISAADYPNNGRMNPACMENQSLCNDKGPLTALQKLEDRTKLWTNVNNQTYTMGTTIFLMNQFTGCDNNLSCVQNKYTLETRTERARMITVQETQNVGCSQNENSCPKWMYTNLDEMLHDGNSGSEGKNYGYWTMSANSLFSAWAVQSDGRIQKNKTNYQNYGARAVVEINKN